MADRQRKKQQRARSRAQAAKGPKLVTIAQYGPDDQTVTKVVAAVLREREKEARKLKRWVGTDITQSPKFRQELLEFIHQVQPEKIVLTRGVIGCIHESGKDYPQGQACPFCPFWKNRDRWAKAKPIVMTLKSLDENQPWPG
ncbi:MAG: hypothetical protein ACYTBZ_07565 [Planctomycetota bacterium]|jgi:hypothetical protein